MIFDGWHLPGLDADGPMHTLEYEGVTVRAPVLDAADVEHMAGTLRARRAAVLAGAPVARIVDAVDGAAARLAGGELRETAETLVAAVARYSPAMARLVLDRMSTDWRRDAMHDLLVRELGDPAVLDGFAALPDDPGRRVMARGPALTFHVFAGNVPGVAVTALVRSLLVKTASLSKTASDEPVLPVLFAGALQAVDPELADCLAVTYWPGTDEEPAGAAAAAADAVVVYGGEDAARAVHAAVGPETSLAVHGPRISFGVVGRAALRTDTVARTAADVARATAIFDQHGCVSPHVVYAERGGQVEPVELAAAVARAFDALEDELPRGPLRTEEAAAVRQVRGAAELQELDGQDVRVFTGPGTAYTVIYHGDSTFAPSSLNRTLWVRPVDDGIGVAALVRPHARLLQSCALAGFEDRTDAVATALARAGASRITTFRELPWPPPAWHHDGAGPLRELVRWTDLEG